MTHCAFSVKVGILMNTTLFLFVAACWAGSFLAIKPLVSIVSPLTAGAMRIGVAVVFLSILLPIMRIPLRAPSEARIKIWICGLAAFSIPFALLFWGETKITPGLAGILNGTVPLWVFGLGLLFTPGIEPFSMQKVFGLLFGLSGICSIFLQKVFVPGGDPSLLGAVAVFLMAASYGTSVLLNRSLFLKAKNLHPFTNLYQQLVSGFLSLSVLAILFEGVPQPSSWTPLSTVVISELYLGVVSTSIAFMMFYRLIREWGSVRAATVTYVIPAVTLVFDLILNGHTPTFNEVIGVAGVTIGVITLNLPASVLSRFHLGVRHPQKGV
jgi:drug/metabolite transporter (DMT)-like permease